METQHGFKLIREETITEFSTRARVYKHVKTGAQLISLANSDENKVFGVAFATPPEDSTGIAHILEHSVLCGSKKYPSKEPFIELAKGSLNTFLNAMTYPDKTIYPVASQNTQDLYNLVDVYLDAVFFPNITEWTLRQEGWHYELDAPDAQMIYKGVVFNEMKGAYASPERQLYVRQARALYPDTPYSVDSGGDPAVIPDLTYAQFKRFHETYYHPSNALIWWYGDDDESERLSRLDAVLSEFDKKKIAVRIPKQKKFTTPKHINAAYDSDDGDGAAKNYVSISWLLTDALDIETNMALETLGGILLGTPASPLRKALIDSGFGEDAMGGFDDGLRQTSFQAGMKGVAPENVDKIEPLIFDTLKRLSKEGIEPEMIEAVMNTTEFRMREMNTGGTPRGLVMMLWSLSTWLHNGDPLEPLRFEAPLSALKTRLAAGERMFESLIDKHLLKNKHRVTLTMSPDKTVREQADAAERARLDAARAKMTPQELEEIIAQTHQLKQMQETPDAPEALAKIPVLKLADIDRENKHTPSELINSPAGAIMLHDLPTNGIVYVDLGFDMRHVPAADVPMLGLMGQVLLGMGTSSEDFVKLSQRIGRKTGGLRASGLTGMRRDDGALASWFVLRGKATPAQTDDLFALIHDVLHDARLDNRERFKQIVLETKAGLESGVVSAGHRVASSRLRARFNPADWYAEQTGGFSYLQFIRELATRVDADWPGVLAQLERMRAALVNRNAMLANVTLDRDTWRSIQPKLEALMGKMPAVSQPLQTWPVADFPAAEGLTIPSQVNYVAKSADLSKLGVAPRGSTLVINNYLNTVYLWDRVRVQGGAYGGFSSYDNRSGVFTFASYRDPNLVKTLSNYDGAAAHLHGLELDEAEVHKCIIGVIGDMDSHELPDAKGYSALTRHLLGISDDSRQQVREEVLGTTAGDFNAFGELLAKFNAVADVVVVGPANGIEAANVELERKLTITKMV
jgi:presequence protease